MEGLDSLPYIDTEISQDQRDAAMRLIGHELRQDGTEVLHSHVRQTEYAPQFSSLVEQELKRCASGGQMKKSIDMSRYEAPDEPSADDDVDIWKSALRNAYTSSTYLSGRRLNLQLLEEFGKNAWLIGNSQLESLLQRLERELQEIKSQTDDTNRARKTAQEASRSELLGLEDTWRRGIGRIIEVQVATEQLRQELNERRKHAAK